jgi:hypothetical protein
VWASVAYDEMQTMLREHYATDGYDSTIHRLRLAIFDGEETPYAVRQTIRALLDQAMRANAREKQARDALWAIYDVWPEDHRDSRPPLPKFIWPDGATEEEVEAEVAKTKAAQDPA